MDVILFCIHTNSSVFIVVKLTYAASGLYMVEHQVFSCIQAH